MSELRRIQIEQSRLNFIDPLDRSLLLSDEEAHYLRRVLRLNHGASFEIVDGVGHLWEAQLKGQSICQLKSTFEDPKSEEKRPKKMLGLAVVIPRKGFYDLIRMCCELGIDYIQPLRSKRSTSKGEIRTTRANAIVREACEQSERLWSMRIFDLLDAEDWWRIRSSNIPVALATTRKKELIGFDNWLDKSHNFSNQIWIAIGPEGGWTDFEEASAISSGCSLVSLGDLILTTSTAAVAASNTMVRWRTNSVNSKIESDD